MISNHLEVCKRKREEDETNKFAKSKRIASLVNWDILKTIRECFKRLLCVIYKLRYTVVKSRYKLPYKLAFKIIIL